MLNFAPLSIENWAVYAPASKSFASDDCKTIRIPANLKRRCSNISKKTLEVASQAMGDRRIDHAVFCSQHGELSCTASLLKGICHKTILSPMNFSQSVHNTAAGLFSVMHNLHQDMVTIAAGDNTFLMGMLETLIWMQLNPGKTVLFVMFDEHIPEEYAAFNVRDSHEYAVAFLLTDDRKKTADKLNLSVSTTVQICNDEVELDIDCARKYPLALEFLEWLLHSTTRKLIQNNDNKIFRWHKIDVQGI